VAASEAQWRQAAQQHQRRRRGSHVANPSSANVFRQQRGNISVGVKAWRRRRRLKSGGKN